MTKRTTLLLDDDSVRRLRELAEAHGSQTLAVKRAIDDAHASLRRRQRRLAFIDWLKEDGAVPTDEDRDWARRVTSEVAAAVESLR